MSTASPAAAPAGTPRRRIRREYLLFLAFIAPNFLVIAVFAYWPVLYNLFLSFTDWNLIAAAPGYAGIGNYTATLTDPAFHQVLLTTVVFTGVVVAGSIVLGLALALLFDQPLKGRGLVRTAAFAPHILSGAAVATIWLFIFDPGYGLMRALLQPMGVTSPDWMTDSTWALPGVIIVYLWKNIGFAALIYLAGLQSLPKDLYEAAAIDGAGPWTLLRRITLPLLTPITFFLLITTIIGTFQAFDIIAVMTAGGPAGSTTILSWQIYDEGFRAFDAGRAATTSIIMFVVLLLMTGLQTRYLEKRVHYR
ncbi:carbohydrate ABC transporter membrane protein 1 (CUT1 family) [Murinocardiopsis flavida]|uniref:Carbohydrate ABC transporter membrane protein 1 (CUT1 family) n=1 Tax=Murinocardiopsis flavida TaxID=645275 RepID=A0A2P8DQ15_9ACTN|nr:sugar ABC transporter permease [Murinocardiopsis flavida]PSK99313.1 carbohydrate ABC transporter membrane protein 1 (CUT1 family) [Murinocardiopsis flavida]